MVRSFREDLGTMLDSGDSEMSPAKTVLFKELCKQLKGLEGCYSSYAYVRSLTSSRSKLEGSDAYLILGQVLVALEHALGGGHARKSAVGSGGELAPVAQLPLLKASGEE